MQPSQSITRLIEIMEALRQPETGCPWDIVQTFETIKPYTLEEAYEVADAIERKDMDDLCDELGDLLLQVVFHARMAEEAGDFAFGDVVEAITRKMIRRHPHVFARSDADTPQAVKLQWDQIKQAEKAERRERRARRGLPEDASKGHLGSVQRSFPALVEALKLQERAAKVGFDWSSPEPILDKIEEEIAELREALASNDKAKVADELGDLIFAVVNIGRHVGADPEMALRGTNIKFRRRFSHIETALEEAGETLEQATLERMEELWQAAKAIERRVAHSNDATSDSEADNRAVALISLCESAYSEIKQFYSEHGPRVDGENLGFRILYGPPVLDPELLFIGFQPGGKRKDAELGETAGEMNGWPLSLDYIAAPWRLAQQIRKIWSASSLEKSSGLNAVFFRSPNREKWDAVPAAQRQACESLSISYVEKIANLMRPKAIVVIGLGTFDMLTNGEVALEINRRTLIKQGKLWGVKTYGVIHLSGARINAQELEAIKSYLEKNS